MESQTKVKTPQRIILSLEEIKDNYPNQWVLVVNPELDDNLEIIRGEVVASCPTKEELYQKLYLRGGQSSAIEYTGNCEDAIGLV